MIIHKALSDEAGTLAFAANIASAILQEVSSCEKILMNLQGNLGTGKTTFSRGLLLAFGHRGSVKSPTYTFVEIYQLSNINVYHYDLYRLADGSELEFLGFHDNLGNNTLTLIEWPERASDYLPVSDLALTLEYSGSGRQVNLLANTAVGRRILEKVSGFGENAQVK